MWQYNYPDELQQSGVKGMKWGRKKSGTSHKESVKKHKAKSASRDKGRAFVDRFKKSADAKRKLKDLYKEYGDIEDQATYGKGNDPKKIAATQRRLDELDKKISSLK